MRYLLLSCNTGGGHNAAAEAIKKQLELLGHEAFVFDYLTLTSEKTSRVVGNLYVNLVKICPKAFGCIYFLGLFVSKYFPFSPVYMVNKKMAKYLSVYLQENHYDGIIMTHIYPAETLTYMKRKGFDLPPTFLVSTDYTCIPFFEDADCDYYISPHQSLTNVYVERGIDEKKIYPLGIPFSPDINKKITKSEARQALKLQDNKKYVLIIGGSMGAGKMVKLVKNFVKIQKEYPINIIAICGNNKRVFQKMNKLFGNNKSVIIMTHTNQIPLYLKACDIIYTKPGGLTSTEAAAARVPFVHTFPIPGCESYNRKFFIKRGMSISGKTAHQMVERGINLLKSPEAMKAMREAQEKNINSYAIENIAEFIIDKSFDE